MEDLLDKAREFNKYFESGNNIPVDAYVRVRPEDWKDLYKQIMKECNKEYRND